MRDELATLDWARGSIAEMMEATERSGDMGGYFALRRVAGILGMGAAHGVPLPSDRATVQLFRSHRTNPVHPAATERRSAAAGLGSALGRSAKAAADMDDIADRLARAAEGR